jgi:hypothetical protein
VLTSTIPVTLTSRLPGGAHLDAAAGLVYDGAGRFYDAALGLYLQPDPFGAAPEAPESLNRYAAPGVSTFPTVGSVPGGSNGALFNSLWTNAAKAATAWGLDKGASLYLRSLHRNKRQFSRMALGELGHFRFRVPDEVMAYPLEHYIGRLRGKSFWRVMDRGGWYRYVDAATGAYDDTAQYLLFYLRRAGIDDAFEFVGSPQFRNLVNKSPLGRLAGRLALTKTGRHALDLFGGAVVDVGFQFVWDLAFERDLTWRERGLRVAAELPGTAASWAIGSATGWLAGMAFGAAAAGPVGLVVGLGVAVIYDLYGKPEIYKRLGLD